ncbi:MAG: hypothetical protein Q9187_005581 [Circinaria calcarea]
MTKSILLADGVTTSVVSSFVEHFDTSSSSQEVSKEKEDDDEPEKRPCVGPKQRPMASEPSAGQGHHPCPDVSHLFKPSKRFTIREVDEKADPYRLLLGNGLGECPVHRSNHAPTIQQSQIDGSSSAIVTIGRAKNLGGALLRMDNRVKGFESISLYNPYKHWFISSRGNEYFCEIDEDYLTDRFNLTGLNTDVQYYQYALDLVTDVFDLDCDDEMRETIEKSARHLYGLVHARYITTTRGLAKMLEKFKKGDFGKCPRVDCKSEHLLPTGMADLPHVQTVKLYCAKCEDLYNPKSSRHATIDGAYFGSSFQNILFQVYPALIPDKSISRYEPRIFGFKVHAAAALQRWQDKRREEMQARLKEVGIENVFVEDGDGGDAEIEDDEEGEEMEVAEDLA